MAVGDSQAGRQTATGRTSGPHPPGLHLTLVLYVPGGWWFSTSNRAHHPHPTPPDPPAKEVWENKQRVVSRLIGCLDAPWTQGTREPHAKTR